jgi:hypothetical protein
MKGRRMNQSPEVVCLRAILLHKIRLPVARSGRLPQAVLLIHFQHHPIRLFFQQRPGKGDSSRRIDGMLNAAPQPRAARLQGLVQRTITLGIEPIGTTRQPIAQPRNSCGSKRIPPVHNPIFIARLVKAIVRVFLQLAVSARGTCRHDVISESEDVSRHAVWYVFDGKVEQKLQLPAAAGHTSGTRKVEHSDHRSPFTGAAPH